MAKSDSSLPWECNPSDFYVPITYEGKVIGFSKSVYASQIVSNLNHAEKLHRALYMACYDLIARAGDNSATVAELMQQYLTKVERPKSGTGAIVLLLRERQVALDLTDDEFAKFCDSFRLSRVELKGIYAGEEIENSQLAPLSRILGLTADELIAVWRGDGERE
ncbi:MAG: hypothetical protein WCA35_06260 [Kovacikia sp.]